MAGKEHSQTEQGENLALTEERRTLMKASWKVWHQYMRAPQNPSTPNNRRFWVKTLMEELKMEK